MNKTLKGKEIIEIIKACRETGVVDFAYGELKFSFVPEAPQVEQTYAVEDVQLSEETLKQLEVEAKLERLSNLLIEDPLEYERLKALDELTYDRQADSEALAG